MNPKVSVIVPVYKVENYLTQCLDSICRQTLEDIEIIVIDEGDRDRCREIIDYFESIDKRIVSVHEKQGGYGNSVNYGFTIAKGEYISIIESDDFVEPDMLEKLYAQATRFGADIVKSPYFQFYNNEKEEILPIIKELILQLPEDKCFPAIQYPILFSTHPSIWAGLYRTEWLKNTGIQFLTKGAYLDIQFRFETLMAAKKICWVKTPFYHWRYTNPTSTNAHWNLKAAFERWDFIHSQFEGKPELWRSLSTYMLPEETLNLFIRYDYKKCTQDERRRLRNFRSLYSDDVVRYCPFVDDSKKRDFLLGSPDLLLLKRKIRRFAKKLKSYKAQTIVYRLFISAMLAAAAWGYAFGRYPAVSFLTPFVYAAAGMCTVASVMYWCCILCMKCAGFVFRRLIAK